MTRRAGIGTMAMLVMLSSGCGTTQSDGTPVPVGNEMRTGDSPARPRELRLDGKDPCALVPRSDWSKFYIEKPGKAKQDEVFKSPECFYSNSVGAFDLTLVMTEDIDAWRGGKRMAEPKEVASIEGFPAISLRRPDDRTGCDVAVDVAEGQYLLAGVLIDRDKLSSVPERCEYAHLLAESAMSTLAAS